MEKFNTSKLWLLFETLSEKELRQLRNFLRSPFYTRREDVFRLYEHLRRHRKKGVVALTAEGAFAYTFPDEAYDSLKLRGTMSDLLELIEQYMLSKHFEKGKLPADFALVSIYRSRGLDKHFRWAMNKLKQKVSRFPYQNADFHSHKLAYQMELMYHQTRNRRTGRLNLQAVSGQMDCQYLAQKLRHACTQLSHQAVYQTEYDFGLLSPIVAQVEAMGFLDVPAIAIYYYCYRFLTEAYSLEYFQAFREQLAGHAALFPEEERKDLYLLAINFCIRQLNRGSAPFAREAWEMYRIGLREGFLLDNGQLSRFAFNNIVGIALKLGETAWAADFIEQYHSSIGDDFREATLSLNQARLAYARADFGRALLLLQNVEYEDLVTNLIARMLLLRIYYLQGELDALSSQLSSLENFVRRASFSQFHKENYLNIARFVKRLISLPPYDKEEREKLRQDIEAADPLSEKEWLLAQLPTG
ncbi:MAG: hypothetical protein KDD10_08975 [Phaeodactylibacter sp.]|nr:hypothetical protein [Phaeodactylibacter sp.]MCB9297876.1 hypothetical protein [Lewinellaceae bacterium]